MPKDTRVPSLSLGRSRALPYSCSSRNAEQCRSKNTLQSAGDEKEWEEARCPICMEHPHNAVLLLCSSHEKGCHPFMCDTSHRHSNCLDQFCKSIPSVQTDLVDDVFRSNSAYNGGRSNRRQLEQKLPCPLCRGQISGWIVIEPARSFMNSRSRSCSLETCNFIGTYLELRKHARLEHPSVCPTEADPIRQREWTRLENERTFQDLLGVSGLGNELSDFADLFPLDDFSSFFPSLESEDEWDRNLEMDMDLDLELPFTFIEMAFPFDVSYQRSVAHSLELSYRPRSREFNLSTSQPANRTRGYSSRRSENRVQHQPNPRWL